MPRSLRFFLFNPVCLHPKTGAQEGLLEKMSRSSSQETMDSKLSGYGYHIVHVFLFFPPPLFFQEMSVCHALRRRT